MKTSRAPSLKTAMFQAKKYCHPPHQVRGAAPSDKLIQGKDSHGARHGIQIIWLLKLFLIGCLSFSLDAQEISPITTGANPVFEQRLQSLVEDLRCPVCQNESLASSRAPLAQDLRKTVQAQMEQGKSDHEILNFLKERYGDFIYYQPPLKSTTLVLWFGPFILLIAGVLGLFVFIKRRIKLGKKQ